MLDFWILPQNRTLRQNPLMRITLPHGTHTAACRQADHGSSHRPPHGWPLLQLRAGDVLHLDGFVPGDNTPDMHALHVAPLFLVVYLEPADKSKGPRVVSANTCLPVAS